MSEMRKYGRKSKTAGPDENGGAELPQDTLALTRSGAFGKMLERLERFAAEEHSVFMQGERGTGKTHLAGLIHKLSPRAHGPYVYVNLAALDPELIPSELFGHVMGAFTSAMDTRQGYLLSAQGGTILLDEIGKAPLSTQRRLLDVLQHRRMRQTGSDRMIPLNVRFVFAANECLDELVNRGSMTADFVDRLGYYRIRVPSLRERVEDIPAIIEVTLSDIAATKGWSRERIPGVSADLLRCLQAYAWPGNVRQLREVIDRLVTDAGSGRVLDERLLVEDLAHIVVGAAISASRAPQRPTMDDVERTMLANKGNKAKSARELGIGRTSLYRVLWNSGTESAHVHSAN